MTICDLCYREGQITEAPETCVECSADMCPKHGEGEYCLECRAREQEYVGVRPRASDFRLQENPA
jgi:hypothetical protein